ncbi:hypothetical protein SEPCBS119000_005018 [Sporothrix epigloea]|uniref:Alpha-galactosidase A n=1 Tax=Sporothrix epigloea TaxID=1892477 RepID=A0ABP0DVC5_9PEZI
MTSHEPITHKPVVLSMEVDMDDATESYYRIQFGSQVKYLIVDPGIIDRDVHIMPIDSLPTFPYAEKWTEAHVSRNKISNDLEYNFSDRELAGVKNQWHPKLIDFLTLEKIRSIAITVFEAVLDADVSHLGLQSTVIAKIARFEWEIPRIEKETRAYQLLEGSGLAPRFLGHIHENGRIMGFVLEKLEGRRASLDDLSSCESAVRKLHGLGLLHGDVNRHNFLVTEEGVILLDFETLGENASPESMCKELESLPAELVEDTGRGGGILYAVDGVSSTI